MLRYGKLTFEISSIAPLGPLQPIGIEAEDLCQGHGFLDVSLSILLFEVSCLFFILERVRRARDEALVCWDARIGEAYS